MPEKTDLTYTSRPTQTGKILSMSRNSSSESTDLQVRAATMKGDENSRRCDLLEDKLMNLTEQHDELLMKYQELAERFNVLIEDRSFKGKPFAIF